MVDDGTTLEAFYGKWMVLLTISSEDVNFTRLNQVHTVSLLASLTQESSCVVFFSLHGVVNFLLSFYSKLLEVRDFTHFLFDKQFELVLVKNNVSLHSSDEFIHHTL
jgi:hypothetical protein